MSTLNELSKGAELEMLPVEEIIQEATGKLFNNAAQTCNHTFGISSHSNTITEGE
ncbi:MAG: hypothetical protein JXM70_07355 [Pirellulales bacterium]|nr:hypothetical protein [Pirellulales bacterium]